MRLWTCARTEELLSGLWFRGSWVGHSFDDQRWLSERLRLTFVRTVRAYVQKNWQTFRAGTKYPKLLTPRKNGHVRIKRTTDIAV